MLFASRYGPECGCFEVKQDLSSGGLNCFIKTQCGSSYYVAAESDIYVPAGKVFHRIGLWYAISIMHCLHENVPKNFEISFGSCTSECTFMQRLSTMKT